MSAFSFILIFVLLVAFIGLLLYLASKNKELNKNKVAPNSENVVLFTRTQFTDGHKTGRIATQKTNKNGTRLLRFFPTDSLEGDFIKPNSEIKKVVVNEGDITTIKGVNSRDLIIVHGRNSTDFPPEMRNTLVMDFGTEKSQLEWMLDILKKPLLLSGDKAIKTMLNEFARGGNMTAETFLKMKEEKEMKEKMQEASKEAEGKK